MCPQQYKITSTNIKTWLTGLNDVQGAINKISALSNTANGATHKFTDMVLVQQYADSLKGLNLQQAQLALSTKLLSDEQKEQILVQAGLKASEDAIQAELLQTTLIEAGLDEVKRKAILTELGLMQGEGAEAVVQGTCTKADLEAVLAQELKNKTDERGILTTLGLGKANIFTAETFELLKLQAKESLLALAKNPLTWVVGAIAAIGLLVKGFDALIGRKEKLARTKIEDLDEDISKYDEEIKSLEELQSKLESAKGNKSELAKIQNELNGVIGETTGLLNGESKSYDVANTKLKANIALKKQQKKLLLNDKVAASKDLFNNNVYENEGWLSSDYTAKEMRDKAVLYTQHVQHYNSLNDNDEYEKRYKENYDSAEDYALKMLGFWDEQQVDWESYWEEQVDTAYDVFENVITSYDGVGGQDFIKNLISNMVRTGSDLSEISTVVQHVIDNEDMQNAINSYWESLVNPDIDSEKALQNVRKVFDGIVKEYPYLTGFFDSFYNQIVSGGKEVINEVKSEAKELEKLSFKDKFQNLWDSEGFANAKKSLEDLSKESKITADDIESLAEENDELATLLEESGMSAQFAASCFDSMCKGGKGFSAITDDALALDKVLHGMDDSLKKVKQSKSEYDKALKGDDYNTEFKNYQEAYKSAIEMFKNGEYGKHFDAAMEYLLGEDSYTMSIKEMYDSVKNLGGIFGENGKNGLQFVEKLYGQKDKLEEFNTTIEKLADGSYKFDFDADEYDDIAKIMGMTTEEVIACVNALGMFGNYKSYNLDDVEKELGKISIAAKDGEKSILSLQAVETLLSDLGYTGKEIHDIMQDIQGMDEIKLLDFSANDEKSIQGIIDKLKELELIEIDGNKINIDGLIESLSTTLGMGAEDIETFVRNLNSKFKFTDAEGKVVKLSDAIKKITKFENSKTVDGLEKTGDAADDTAKNVGSVNDELDKVEGRTFKDTIFGIFTIGDEAEKARKKVKKLNDSVPKSPLTWTPITNEKTDDTDANGTFNAHANGTNVSIRKNEKALVNELGEEGLVRNGKLIPLTGGAQFINLKRGDIIFNHKQMQELKKNGYVTSNGGRGKLIGAHANGTISAYDGGTSGAVLSNNPATGKQWTTKSSDKTKKDLKDTKKDLKDTVSSLDRISEKISEIQYKVSDNNSFKQNMRYTNQLVKYIEKNLDKVKKMYEDYKKAGDNTNAKKAYSSYKKMREQRDEAEISKFDLIKNKYDNKTKKIEKDIEVRQSKDKAPLSSQYSKQAELTFNKRTDLTNQLNKLVEDKAIKKFSTKWYEMKDAIDEATLSLDEYIEKLKNHDSSTSFFEQVNQKIDDKKEYRDTFNYNRYSKQAYRDYDAGIEDVKSAKKVEKKNIKETNAKIKALKKQYKSGEINEEDYNANIKILRAEKKDSQAFVKNSGRMVKSLKNGKIQIDIDKNQADKDNLEHLEALTDHAIAYDEAVGNYVDTKYYQDKINISKNRQAELNEDLSNYRKQLEGLDEGSLEYEEKLAELRETELQINEETLTQLEYENKIRESNLEKLQDQLSLLEATQSELQSINDLTQAMGKDLSANDYQKLIDNNLQQISNLQGTISATWWSVGQGTKDLATAASQVSQLNAQINQLKVTNEDLKKQMRDDVYWRDFERAHTAVQNLQSVLESMVGFIDDDMMFIDGQITDFGISKLATLSHQFIQAKEEVSNYMNDLENLEKLYAKGMYTENEYKEKLQELKEGLLGAAENVKGFSDSIVDLNRTLMENELDELKELVDARVEALQKKKDYYDYDKTLRNSNKNIQQLKAEIKALEGVSDAESRAKKARLEADLAEAEEELADTKYDHYITLVTDGLNETVESLEEKMEEYFEKLATDFDEIANIMLNAAELYESSADTVAATYNNLLTSLGVDTSQYNWNNLTGFASGGIVDVVKRNGDDAIVSVKRKETIMPTQFTELMAKSMPVLEDLVKYQVPDYSKILANVGTREINCNPVFNLNVQGDVTKDALPDLKTIINESVKEMQRVYVKSATNNGWKRKY